MRGTAFLSFLVVLAPNAGCLAPVELDNAEAAQKVYDACREAHPNESDRCAYERAEANRRWTAYEDEVERERQHTDDGTLWPWD